MRLQLRSATAPGYNEMHCKLYPNDIIYSSTKYMGHCIGLVAHIFVGVYYVYTPTNIYTHTHTHTHTGKREVTLIEILIDMIKIFRLRMFRYPKNRSS